MSIKKRKVDAKCREFNSSCTAKKSFTVVGIKTVCLVCNEHVAVFKNYNLSRHFETKQETQNKKYRRNRRCKGEGSQGMLAKLQKQQGLFTKLHAMKEDNVCNSYV